MFNVYVDLSVSEAFVSQELLDIVRVSCAMILHRRFPMTEGVKRYQFQSWILKLWRCTFSGLLEVPAPSHYATLAENFLACSRQGVQHTCKLRGDFDDAWVASLFRPVY